MKTEFFEFKNTIDRKDIPLKVELRRENHLENVENFNKKIINVLRFH